MREYKVRVPFIGYSDVIIEIENEGDFDSDKELEEAAWEQASEMVYQEMRHVDCFETEERVQAVTNDRYAALIYKFDSTIEDITIGFEDDELEEENDE